MTERGSGRDSSGRRAAAEAATLTPSDDDADCNETMSVVSNCSDLQTTGQLTDGTCTCSVFVVRRMSCFAAVIITDSSAATVL